MFIIILVIFVICGISLLLKAKKMSNKQELRVIIGLCGIVLIISGIILAYNLISENIELPLH